MRYLIKPEGVPPEIFSKKAMSAPDDELDKIIDEEIRSQLRETLVIRLDLLDRGKYSDELLAKVDKLRTVCANISNEDFLKYLIDEPDGKTVRDYIDKKYSEITGKEENDGSI